MNKHIQALEKAIEILQSFDKKTSHPNPEAYQFIGTFIYYTNILFTATANSLDKQNRIAHADGIEIWKKVQAIIYRGILSNLHGVTEVAINQICQKKMCTPQSSFKKRFQKEFNLLREGLDPSKIHALDKIERNFDRAGPSFEDKTNEVIKHFDLDNPTKEQWRLFFKGFTILRNKASHDNVTLSDKEIQTLKKANMKSFVKDNYPQLNPLSLAKLIKNVLNFLDLIYLNKA